MNHRSRFSLLSLACLAFASTLLVACAGEAERPPALDGDGSQGYASVSSATVVCRALEHRTCKIYFTDSFGNVNCPESFQFCNEDGSAWYDCGEFELAYDGTPRPPANPKSAPKHAPKGNGNGNANGNGNGKAP